MEIASSKMRGRICANDTDKVANINPMLSALLRRRINGEIAELIKDKLDSTCVLAELLLRYYDSESDKSDKPAPMRWFLAPYEMQLLVKVMQWLKDRRQKQLKTKHRSTD
jgi:hypothetical protein